LKRLRVRRTFSTLVICASCPPVRVPQRHNDVLFERRSRLRRIKGATERILFDGEQTIGSNRHRRAGITSRRERQA
jgi:hypothetical protein